MPQAPEIFEAYGQLQTPFLSRRSPYFFIFKFFTPFFSASLLPCFLASSPTTPPRHLNCYNCSIVRSHRGGVRRDLPEYS